MIEEKEIQKRVQQIESVIHEVEAMADPNLRAKTAELVQSLMDYHAAGLERLMEIIANSGQSAHSIFDEFTRDKLVESLLLLYGLHPLDLETRVRQALDKVRPHINSHGGSVELLGIADGIVLLRLGGSRHGCASSVPTLKTAIEEALYEAAPDMTAIQFEAAAEQQPPTGFVPLASLRGAHRP